MTRIKLFLLWALKNAMCIIMCQRFVEFLITLLKVTPADGDEHPFTGSVMPTEQFTDCKPCQNLINTLINIYNKNDLQTCEVGKERCRIAKH